MEQDHCSGWYSPYFSPPPSDIGDLAGSVTFFPFLLSWVTFKTLIDVKFSTVPQTALSLFSISCLSQRFDSEAGSTTVPLPPPSPPLGDISPPALRPRCPVHLEVELASIAKRFSRGIPSPERGLPCPTLGAHWLVLTPLEIFAGLCYPWLARLLQL